MRFIGWKLAVFNLKQQAEIYDFIEDVFKFQTNSCVTAISKITSQS